MGLLVTAHSVLVPLFVMATRVGLADSRIDGATYLQIFWHIIRPIAAPVVATMTIFAFLANWNEFVFVFVLTSRQALRSLPLGVNAFAGEMSRDYGLLFVALVIATIPMITPYRRFTA